MARVLFTVLAFIAVASVTHAEELTFKNRGKAVAKLSLAEAIKKVAPKTIPIWEPHEGVQKKYTGIQMNELLTAVYGADWKATEELLFTCVDGYQPSIPAERFKKSTSYLVYEVPGAKFTVNNKFQNEKDVELGPFYLVWDNVSEPSLKEEGATYWPYQVTGVDLIQFRDRFPNSGPPVGSPPEAVKGYLDFRAKCMSCHAVNGEGAPKAVELNYPASVTEYFREGWLEKWILNPTSLRYNTTMPGLQDQDKNAKKMVKDIIAYLKVMAKHKVKPKE